MIRSTAPDQPPQEPEPSRGLEDPRVIHPSPESLVPDPAESLGVGNESPSESDPDPVSSREELATEEKGRGMVDPRNVTAGPDL